jgi:hypothetical protein
MEHVWVSLDGGKEKLVDLMAPKQSKFGTNKLPIREDPTQVSRSN